MSSRKKVTGVGGIFIKSDNPEKMKNREAMNPTTTGQYLHETYNSVR